MTGQRGAMFVVAGFAGLLLIMAVFSGWQGASRLTNREDETKAVEEAARGFVEAYGTFDFRDLESYRQRLLSLTSGSVRDAVAGSQVDPVAAGQKRTTMTNVTSVSVTAISNDAAAASVTAVQLRRSVDLASGTLIEERVVQRVACRLVREGDRWLVSEFRLLSEEPVSPTPQR